MGFGWQEIDKTLDLSYIRVAGLHRGCKPAVLFDPPNFRPHTMAHRANGVWLDWVHCDNVPSPTIFQCAQCNVRIVRTFIC